MSSKALLFNILSLIFIVFLIKHHNLYRIAFELKKQLLTFGSQGKVTILEDGSLVFNQTGLNLNNINQTIPDCFPTNLPIFPGAVIDLSCTTINEDNCSLNLQTTAPVKEVVNFYQNWLPRKGWLIDNLNQLNKQTYLTINNSKWQGSILISQKDRGSRIAIDLY